MGLEDKEVDELLDAITNADDRLYQLIGSKIKDPKGKYFPSMFHSFLINFLINF